MGNSKGDFLNLNIVQKQADEFVQNYKNKKVSLLGFVFFPLPVGTSGGVNIRLVVLHKKRIDLLCKTQIHQRNINKSPPERSYFVHISERFFERR